jgi:hypothetical protein
MDFSETKEDAPILPRHGCDYNQVESDATLIGTQEDGGSRSSCGKSR